MTNKHEKVQSEKDKMLAFLKLDVEYFDGKGDYLFYKNKKGETVEVLDLVGSYGVNFLGHKNEVVTKLHREIHTFPPNFVQASIHSQTQQLSARLNRHLHQHTQQSNWVCEFANTGTEIIEVAMKLAVLQYQRRLEQVRQDIYLSIQLANKNKAPAHFIQQFRKQLAEIEASFYFLHFENSFHGKTLGALSLMGNSAYTSSFPCAVKPIIAEKDAIHFITQIHLKVKNYKVLNAKTGKLMNKTFLPIAGIFVEPIQGEAGVFPLPQKVLAAIANIQKNFNIPVISDEIQCGLYRTGHFSALAPEILIADIYCFGKSLGAGIAKIAALCCAKKVYTPTFFDYHSSTFGEDYVSAWAANQFFKGIQKAMPKIAQIQSNQLHEKLLHFAKLYPGIIKAIRGKGYMLGLELHLSAIHQSFTSKFLKDMDKIGYWVSSVLLQRENIRILPTLSNANTFRIQPSLHFDKKELKFMFRGLTNFFEALKNEDLQYLFGHLLPISDSARLNILPKEVCANKMPKNATVFLCHPVDIKHLSDIIHLLKGLPRKELKGIVNEMGKYQNFTIYHVDKLKNNNGKEIDVVFLGIPMTSESFYQAIRSNKRKEWIKKIQDAVDFANAHEAKSIGLGQFTSIITNNGLCLHSPKSTLTTGNAYTAGLTIKAIAETLKENGKSPAKSQLSIIGAGGNILSVTALLLVKKYKKINLVYRQGLSAKKTVQSVVIFLQNCLDSPHSFPLKSKLQQWIHRYPLNKKLPQLIAQLSDFLQISATLESIKQSEVILIGTNSTQAILSSEMVKSGAIIVDLAVPPNTSLALQQREDIVYIKGGISALPIFDGKEQSLDSVILPLEKGESFACMAETFGIAFEDNWQGHNIGDISPEMVENIMRLMDNQGFGLKRIKVEDSV